MGQRLNIEIKRKNKVIVNSYYHWSGYSHSAIHLTAAILNTINNTDASLFINDKIYATCLLATTGARIMDDQLKYAKKYGFTDNELDLLTKGVNRDDGLISLRPKYQKDFRKWEEARVSIDLDSRTVNMRYAFLEYTTEQYEKYHGVDPSNFRKLSMPINRIPFDDFSAFLSFADRDDDFISGKNVFIFIR